MNKPLVSIILPVYNGMKYIKKTIESLLSQDYENFEIMVIDDCSTDGSFEFIKDLFYGDHPNWNIRILKNIKNLGCIATCNRAIRLSKGEYIFRTDQDTLYDHNVLTQLMETLQSDKTGAVGCKLLYPDSDMIRAFGLKINKLLRTEVIGRGHIDYGQYQEVMEVDGLPGGAMLFRKSLGLFNEDYKLYYSEPEWCLNAKKKGYKILVNPKAIAIKFGTKEKLGIKKRYYLYKDKIMFIKNQLFKNKETKKEVIKEWEGYITQ